jgi:hypothetical protein
MPQAYAYLNDDQAAVARLCRCILKIVTIALMLPAPRSSIAPDSALSCTSIVPLSLYPVMPAISSHLPSRPDSVLLRSSKSHASGSTGFEPAAFKNTTDSKSKLRLRMYLSVPTTVPETPETKTPNALLDYFEEESNRKEDASCVFILWGSRDSERSPTWAVDVQITDVDNEGEIFQTLSQRYSTEIGFLRRTFSLREFEKLEPVTVCVLWLSFHVSILTFSSVPHDTALLPRNIRFHGAFGSSQIPCKLLRRARHSSRGDEQHYGLRL